MCALPCAFMYEIHTLTHTYSKTNYSISGVKTTLRRALIRACVPTNAVATEDPRGCSNTCVSGHRVRICDSPYGSSLQVLVIVAI